VAVVGLERETREKLVKREVNDDVDFTRRDW
jgi:hypothetical protein